MNVKSLRNILDSLDASWDDLEVEVVSHCFGSTFAIESVETGRKRCPHCDQLTQEKRVKIRIDLPD